MKVEFEWTIDSEQNLKRICKLLGLKCRKDKKYVQHFFGCDAPNTGYIIDVEGPEEKATLFIIRAISYYKRWHIPELIINNS